MKKGFLFFAILLVALCISLPFIVQGCNKTPSTTTTTTTTTTTAPPPDRRLELVNPSVLNCDLGTEFNASAMIVKYIDGEHEVTLSSADYRIEGTVDTKKVGAQQLTILYDTLSLSVTVTVSPSYTIGAFDFPEFVDVYLNNREATQEQSKFTRPVDFYVGDDNPFIFFPRISAWDENGDHKYLQSYISISTIEQKNTEGRWVLLEGDALDAVVAIDETKSSYDFTEAAVGNTYRLTVSPASDNTFSLSFEFTVVDAWNVYTAKDLSRVDNTGINAWADYKAANGIDNTHISGVVLQNNIMLFARDFPATYFHTATSQSFGKEGWMRDRLDMYDRTIAEGDTFSFYGNSFTIDASALPTIPEGPENLGGYGDDFSSSTLFRFVVDLVEDTVRIGYVNVQDLNLVGNSCLVTDNVDAVSKGLGGLVGISLSRIVASVENTNSKMFLAPYYIRHESTISIEDSRMYDSLQNAILVLGGGHVSVNNCIIKYCGGPIFIAILQYAAEPSPTDRAPYITIDDKTVLENPIYGDEAWFSQLGLTEVANAVKDISSLIEKGCISINNQLAHSGKGIPIMSLTKPGEQTVEPIGILLPDGNSFVVDLPIDGDISIADVSRTNLDAVAALREKISKSIGKDASKNTVIIESNGVFLWTDGTNLYTERKGNVAVSLMTCIIDIALGKAEDDSVLKFFSGNTITVHLASNALVLSAYQNESK